VKFKVWDYSCN